jgi:CRP/FNR family cyclic AMP-dependent transcriptional regulator
MFREDGKYKINILAELTSDELKKLLSISVTESYGKRDVVFLPGDERSHIYVVLEGTIKLSRLSEDGREIIITTAEAGELIGELAIIDAGDHDTMAEMMSNGRVAAMAVEDFKELLVDIPQLSLIVARIMGIRRMLLESKLEDLAFRNVPARLAKFLLEQASIYGKAEGNAILLPSHYSQQEIGSMIGSTRETTSHFLNDFRKSGIIDFNKRLISILEPSKLAELCKAV